MISAEWAAVIITVLGVILSSISGACFIYFRQRAWNTKIKEELKHVKDRLTSVEAEISHERNERHADHDLITKLLESVEWIKLTLREINNKLN